MSYGVVIWRHGIWQYCPRRWLVASRHQAITSPNVDLASIRIYMKYSNEMVMGFVVRDSIQLKWKITCLIYFQCMSLHQKLCDNNAICINQSNITSGAIMKVLCRIDSITETHFYISRLLSYMFNIAWSLFE